MTIIYNPQIVTDSLQLCIDPTNFNSYSKNVMPYPTDNFEWSRAAALNTCSISRDLTINRSPAGGIPLKMVVQGTDAYISSYSSSIWNLASAANGQTWTMSFWARSSVSATALPFLFGASSSGAAIEIPSTTFTVTTFWQRFSFAVTFTNPSTQFVQARLGCTTNGATIWFDGIQVELGNTATDFSPVTNTSRALIYNLANKTTVAAGQMLPINDPPQYNTTPRSLLFNGSSQYITCGNVFNVTATGLSCFAWINQTNVGSAWGPIFAKRNSTNVGWSLTINFPGILLFNNDSTGQTAGPVLASNTWYYIGFTASNIGVVEAYVNAVAYSLGSFSFNNNTVPFYIGLFNESIQFSGSRGHTTVYTKELSRSEVLQNYNATKSRYV